MIERGLPAGRARAGRLRDRGGLGYRTAAEASCLIHYMLQVPKGRPGQAADTLADLQQVTVEAAKRAFNEKLVQPGFKRTRAATATALVCCRW